jgi:DNA-directed RNA polymerase subunit N (RpoN/RPB10)
MLDSAWDWVRSIDWTTFGAGFASAIPPATAVGKLWVAYRKRRKAEAAGSRYLMKDGVDKHCHRYSTLTLKSWEGVDLRLTSIRFYWPPFTGVHVLTGDRVLDPAADSSKERSFHVVDRPPIIVSPVKETSFGIVIKLNRWTRFCALWKARARVRVKAETLDAEARTVSLGLRSRRVDWERTAQE